MNLEAENYYDTLRILNDLKQKRESEFRSTRGATASLYRADVSCTGFMDSDPNAQILFAAEQGLIPQG